MTRLGLYGGSFDPIHYGHLRPVARAAEALALDRVIYLPTAQPPHKLGRAFAPAPHRFAMVEMALGSDERMRVSDFEMREQPSYTIDTVEYFSAQEADPAVYLILGADSLAQLESWRRWEELAAAAHLAVLRRPGCPREEAWGALGSKARRLLEDRLTWIDNEPEDVSATEIRERLATGRQVPPGWAPASVVDYARQHCLYS